VAALAEQEGRAGMKIGGGLFLLLISSIILVLVVRRQATTPGDAERNPTMPEMPDRNEVEGKLKQGVGAVQETAGRATGNDQLAAEGRARQDEGTAQEAIGQVQHAVGDAMKDIEDKLGG
jgi:uncharacterized protein YjbJ (UPF0337 family)